MELQIFLVVAVGILIATRLPGKPQLDAHRLEGSGLQPVPVSNQKWYPKR